MLLMSSQRHSKIEQQEATIAELKSTLAQQQKSFQSKLAEQEKRIPSRGLDSKGGHGNADENSAEQSDAIRARCKDPCEWP